MSTPLKSLISGTFTSAGAVEQFIPLPSDCDYIELLNLTDTNTPDAGATTQCMRAFGSKNLNSGAALVGFKTNGASTIALETPLATNGFTFISDSKRDSVSGAVTNITGITQANPAVASTASPAKVGQIVRLYSTTGMHQIAGWDFTVTAVTAGVSMTFGYLNSAAFAAPATAGSWRVINDSRFYPRVRFITAISTAANAVIQMSVTHNMLAGQKVRIKCPSEFAMTQIDGLIGTILSVNTATNTITTDIDSSAFTAFAFPSDATAADGTDFPQVIPIGEAATSTYQNLLDDAVRNDSAIGVLVGAGAAGAGILTAQSNGKVYEWHAHKGVSL